MSSHLRRHPRFISQQKVEVELADRRDLQELWMLDISKGGLFIQTEAPPAHGTELEIGLNTPDGTLKLKSRVVHVVDVATAKTSGQRAGVGVQFIDLSKELRGHVERYVDGVEARLAAGLEVEGKVVAEPLEALLEQARAINTSIAGSDLYGALMLAPRATAEEIRQRVTVLCKKLTNPPAGTSPPKAARLNQVASQLERAAALFANPLRRLHFDFNHGYVRVEERRAAGEDVDHLRSVWSEAFPERVNKAKELARFGINAAEHNHLKEAADFARQAIELDPFNEELRRAEEAWRSGNMPVALEESEAPAPGAEVAPSQIMQELLQLQNVVKTASDRQILGVGEKATPQEIEAAYQERAWRYDPFGLRGHVPPSVLKIAEELKRRLDAAYKLLSAAPAAAAPAGAAPAGAARAARGAQAAHTAQPTEDVALTGDFATKNEMGVVYLRKQAYAKAREKFKEAMDGDPKNVEYCANYAWSMIVDAHFDRKEALALARPLLEQAIEHAPKAVGAQRKRIARYHYFLGRLLREHGAVSAARQNFADALDLDEGLAEAATELRLIEARHKK